MRSVLVVLLLAGCAAPPTAGPEPQAPSEPAETLPWTLELSDCNEAGGIAIYGRTFYDLAGHHVPAPWILADVSNELENPRIGSNGDPIIDYPVGHWHMAVSCQTATAGNQSLPNVGFGWVGIMVEPPAWDLGGADLHFLLSGFSLPPPLAAELQAQGLPITNSGGATVSLSPTTDAMHDDETKGIYEVTGVTQQVRNNPDRIYRMWMIVDNGTYQPISFDWHSTAAQQEVSLDTNGWGCHSRTPMHGPQGFLCGLSVVTSLADFNRTIVLGGQVNETLPAHWDH